MVQSAQDRYSLDPLASLNRVLQNLDWRGDTLVQPLMRPGLIVKVDIFPRQPSQVPLTEDDEVIEAFATDTAQQPFADRIRLRRGYRGMEQPNARTGCHAAEG